MADKYIRNVAGTLTEREGLVTSAGAGDAGKIPALDAAGRLTTSLMPTGIGADTEAMPASEALAAGDIINVWNDAGVARVRKADASAAGKEGNGFVLSAFASGATATVYFEGRDDQFTGLTAGAVFLSPTTPGRVTGTAPTTAGQVVQRLGVAVAATTVNFEPGPAITLA